MKFALVFAVACAACGNAKPATGPAQASTQTPPPPPATTDNGPSKPVSTSLAISGDILAACKIEFSNASEAPKFDYDGTDLQGDDVRVLTQVATCLTTGPLKGRSVELVGRADPRGSDQYNMALGAKRAHQVTTFLQQHGVSTHVRETSRGAIDATGHDEAGWRSDRRVDLVLGS
jgi:outer membrane protein OmpA-like peptidoglycan-associated protein